MIRLLSCPICRRPVHPPSGREPGWLPFCSERCRQIDLLRWCEGKYAIVEQLSPEELDEQVERTAQVGEDPADL